MSTCKLLITGFLLIVINSLSAQEYEVLFLKQQYDKIIKRSSPPKSSEDVYWQAQALDHQGKTLKAISILEANTDTILTSMPNQLKADLYYKTGQYPQALPYYVATSEDANSFKKLMTIFEFNGKYMTAMDSVKQRLVQDSTNLDYLQILANCYYKSDATIMATQTYEKIYAINPQDLVTARKLAILNINTQKENSIRRAIAIADKVLESDSTNSRFLRIKGRGHYILSQYQDALTSYKMLHKEGSRSIATFKHLGICEYKTAKYDDAIGHLKEADLLDPDDEQTNLFLGKSYNETRQTAKALEHLKRVDELIQPSNETMTSLLWEKQSCYRKLKDFEKVDSLLHELTKYDKKSDYYFYIASNQERGLKNKEKAQYYYELFLEHSATPQEIKKTAQLRELAQRRMEIIKEDEFWKKESE